MNLKTPSSTDGAPLEKPAAAWSMAEIVNDRNRVAKPADTVPRGSPRTSWMIAEAGPLRGLRNSWCQNLLCLRLAIEIISVSDLTRTTSLLMTGSSTLEHQDASRRTLTPKQSSTNTPPSKNQRLASNFQLSTGPRPPQQWQLMTATLEQYNRK